jgi:c-di-GMP-binding flagellar brake protein YcgR
MNAVDRTQTGILSRSATEIGRVLAKAMKEGVPLNAYFPSATFQAPLVHVDPKAGRILIGRCRAEAANAAVLARPRCTFHCEMGGWHIEFVAAEPRAVVYRGHNLIQCRFPELLASNPRRAHERVRLRSPLPLRVQADAAGIMPFDALIIDLGLGGVGFLAYASAITLEPGTVLRGCRIALPGGAVCVADLEVRYSQAVTLPNGRRAMRSGCRFLSTPPEVAALTKRLMEA